MRDWRRISSSSGSSTWRRPDSTSNTMMRSRGISLMLLGRRRIAQRRGEVGRHRRHATIRRQFAADQYVIDVGVGLEFVDRTQDIGEPQALVPGRLRRAGTRGLRPSRLRRAWAAAAGRAVNRHCAAARSGPTASSSGTLTTTRARRSLTRTSAARLVSASAVVPPASWMMSATLVVALDLVDRRPLHFAVDGHGGRDRRNEDDVARK